jgi:phenylacetic acid degradation protein
VGNPAKKIREVSDAMMAWKTEGTKLYQQLPKDLFESLKACEPLRKMPEQYKIEMGDYKTWNDTK